MSTFLRSTAQAQKSKTLVYIVDVDSGLVPDQFISAKPVAGHSGPTFEFWVKNGL